MQEDATFEPFLSSNSWGGALFTSTTSSDPQNEEDKKLVEVCRRLLANLFDGNCSLTFQHRNNKLHFDEVEISGKGRTKKKYLSPCKIEQPVRPEVENRGCLAVNTGLVEEYYEELNKVGGSGDRRFMSGTTIFP